VVDHDHALEDISRTIAAEVERHTTDALVQSQHSLQLAVNSIAQLALAMAESARDITADVSPESATALLDSFRVDLDAILAQLGFESLGTSVGATFDPHRHRALKRLPTVEAAMDKTITRVIRDGYSSTATGRILLFADVEVSRYLP
jgi:molecular chaperone GrpE (heat shock protein)